MEMAAPADVEADETTFDKKDLGSAAADPANSIEWEQWCGMVQRGVPSSLVISCLMPKISAKRAPGPGAIRKMEWGPLAKKHLQGRQVILHTDAAKSYKTKINGVLHDNVRHCKKRVKVAGKFVWKAPVYGSPCGPQVSQDRQEAASQSRHTNHRQSMEVPQGAHSCPVQFEGRLFHSQSPD